MQESERITGEGRVRETDLVAVDSSIGQKNSVWFMEGLSASGRLEQYQSGKKCNRTPAAAVECSHEYM